jgi:hypothetical protein
MNTWRDVIMVAVFVAAAVGAAALHQNDLAGVLAGAAAGYVSQNHNPGSGPSASSGTGATVRGVAPALLALAGGGAAAMLGG